MYWKGGTVKKTTTKGDRSLLKKTLFIFCVFFALLLAALACNLDALEKAAYPRKYQTEVEEWSAQFGVDPMLVFAVIRTESGFDPAAESGVGARGLMQITEETFSWIKLKHAPEEAVVYDDLFDGPTNIRFGVYFLSRCLVRYQDVATAVAAYHSGWGTVDALLKDARYSADGKTLTEFPYVQMNLYVHKVTKAYAVYQKLYTER